MCRLPVPEVGPLVVDRVPFWTPLRYTRIWVPSKTPATCVHCSYCRRADQSDIRIMSLKQIEADFTCIGERKD